MKALARLEALLQGLVERPQSLLTPKRVHPLMLSAAMARAFEANVLPVGDRVIGPNELTIALHPADFAGFEEGVRQTIEGEMAAYMARAAVERGLTLRGIPRVRLVSDSAVRVGAVEVRAAFSEPVAPTVVTPPINPGYTEKMDRAQLDLLNAAANRSAGLELLNEAGAVVERFALDRPNLTLGRRSENDIPLRDIEVSRQHARIEVAAPYYYLSDLGSTNGTRLNGRPVRDRCALKDGDVIEVGHQRLRVRLR